MTASLFNNNVFIPKVNKKYITSFVTASIYFLLCRKVNWLVLSDLRVEWSRFWKGCVNSTRNLPIFPKTEKFKTRSGILRILSFASSDKTRESKVCQKIHENCQTWSPKQVVHWSGVKQNLIWIAKKIVNWKGVKNIRTSDFRCYNKNSWNGSTSNFGPKTKRF